MDQRKIKACSLRKNILDMIMSAKSGHIGGDFSVLETLMVLFDRMHVRPDWQDDPNRDRFILSKGHTTEALYAVLCDHGFLELPDILQTYCRLGSHYIGHPNNKLPGIEMNTGALGHGLSVGVGMALAGKLDGRPYRVYTVMGDGELAEGSVWEAAMAASHYHLDNLCAAVDRNRLQISGSTEDVMHQDDLEARFTSFGWHVVQVEDGNDFSSLEAAFEEAERTKEKPTLVIANTVKGHGSPLMEGKAIWHHRIPTEEEYARIAAEIEAEREALYHE